MPNRWGRNILTLTSHLEIPTSINPLSVCVEPHLVKVPTFCLPIRTGYHRSLELACISGSGIRLCKPMQCNAGLSLMGSGFPSACSRFRIPSNRLSASHYGHSVQWIFYKKYDSSRCENTSTLGVLKYCTWLGVSLCPVVGPQPPKAWSERARSVSISAYQTSDLSC